MKCETKDRFIESRAEKLEFISGQFLLTEMDIGDLMEEEEKELENLTIENKIAIKKERLEKYEELFVLLDEAGGIIQELIEQSGEEDED